MRTALPLELRVPLPPPGFVGRERELAALAAAMRRAPVAVVQGPPAIGKTAVLLQVLNRLPARRLEAVRYIRLGGTPPAEAVLKALLVGRPQRTEDWGAVLADPQAAAAAALDLAESDEAWLAVDADEGEGSSLLSWIATLARHARRSRWIISTRASLPPDPWLAGQVVALGPLAEVDQQALAAQLGEGREAGWVQWALRVAAGSPGWLRQALVAGRAGRSGNPPALPDGGPWPESDETKSLQALILPGLSEEDATALLHLAVVEVPLPAGVGVPLSPQARHRLEAAGWLTTSPGLSLASLARAHLAAVTPGDLWQRASAVMAEALAPEPAHRLEGVRLRLAALDAAGAAAWLDQHGEALVAMGHGPRLHAMLASHRVPVLARWFLRVAAESGSAALRTLVAPPWVGPAEPALRFEWARVLAARGELEAAATWAAGVREPIDSTAIFPGEVVSPEQVRAALHLQARCLMNMGRLAEALDLLAPLDLRDDLPAMALAVSARVALGRPGAIEEARALASRAAASTDPDAVRVRLPVALLFYRQGLLREAEQAFNSLVRDEALVPLAIRRPEVGVVWFAVLNSRGRLAEASHQLDRLQAFFGEGSLWGWSVAFGRVAVRLALGHLDGLAAEVERLIDLVDQTNHSDFKYFGRSLREELARLTGRRLPERAERAVASDDERSHTGRSEERRLRASPGQASPAYVDLWALNAERRRVRQGEQGPGVRLVAEHVEEGQVLSGLLAADRALVAGDAAAAHAEAHRARLRARDHGLAVHEAEALCVMLEASLLHAEPLDREAWAALSESVATLASPRFAAEHRFFSLGLAATPDWAAFEALAGQPAELPAVRRARAWLGATDVPLDAADRAILATFHRRWPVALAGRPWAPGWGIDRRHLRAWLPDGTWIELGGRPQLWKLLRALADGLEAKEALVVAVWDETDYHPLRHDNRLHATVRNLRLALADEQAVRIRTTESGYALGGHPRVVEESTV